MLPDARAQPDLRGSILHLLPQSSTPKGYLGCPCVAGMRRAAMSAMPALLRYERTHLGPIILKANGTFNDIRRVCLAPSRSNAHGRRNARALLQPQRRSLVSR